MASGVASSLDELRHDALPGHDIGQTDVPDQDHSLENEMGHRRNPVEDAMGTRSRPASRVAVPEAIIRASALCMASYVAAGDLHDVEIRIHVGM
jgi:hypothetical protein